MKKSLVALFLVICMVVSFASCGGGSVEEEIIGTWIVDAEKSDLGDMDGMEGMVEMITFTFEEDGKGNMAVLGQEMELTYEINGDAVSITIEGDAQEFKYDDGSLIAEVDGDKMVLKKK